MSPGQYDIPMDLCVKTRRKLRLEEFLRQNLDHAPAGHVIQWVNRNEGVFRILWTHQSSGAFTHDDAALFRYWALARGKPANLSSVELKQSLRMALNKSPSVERVSASQDEFRYFRFTDWQNEGSSNHTFRNEKFLSPYLNNVSTTLPSPQFVYSNSDSDIYQRGLSFTGYYSAISRCSSSSSVSSVESYSSYSNSSHSYESNYRLQILGGHGSTLQDLSHQTQKSFLESTRDSNKCLCEQQRGLPYR